MRTIVNPALTGAAGTHLLKAAKSGAPGVVTFLQGPDISEPTRKEINAEKGALLWGKLHRRSLAMEGRPDGDWLETFGRSLPCGDCKRHWAVMLKATPPYWSDYFAWTVDRHNEVNRRLGKPVCGSEAARWMWSQAPIQTGSSLP